MHTTKNLKLKLLIFISFLVPLVTHAKQSSTIITTLEQIQESCEFPSYPMGYEDVDARDARHLTAFDKCINRQFKLADEIWAKFLNTTDKILLSAERKAEINNLLEKLQTEFEKKRAITISDFNGYYNEPPDLWFEEAIDWLKIKTYYLFDSIEIYIQAIEEHNEGITKHNAVIEGDKTLANLTEDMPRKLILLK